MGYCTLDWSRAGRDAARQERDFTGIGFTVARDVCVVERRPPEGQQGSIGGRLNLWRLMAAWLGQLPQLAESIEASLCLARLHSTRPIRSDLATA